MFQLIVRAIKGKPRYKGVGIDVSTNKLMHKVLSKDPLPPPRGYAREPLPVKQDLKKVVSLGVIK